MPITASRKQRIIRLRARGWLGFLTALAAIAAVGAALFFWAGGSALGALIAIAVAVVCVAIAGTIIVVNKHDSPDPDLGSRMARLRRSRYRSAYPRPKSEQGD